MSEPAVFLDRDGTVIVDRGYLEDAAGVELIPGASEALRRLRDAGFRLVLITNQSGIGRGYFGADAIRAQHDRLGELLRDVGVKLDAIGICPHAPDAGCDCRKPKPRMLTEAAAELDIDVSRSYMVGDKPSDVGAGLAAGCRAVLIGERRDGREQFHAPDLAAAAEWILKDADRQ